MFRPDTLTEDDLADAERRLALANIEAQKWIRLVISIEEERNNSWRRPFRLAIPAQFLQPSPRVSREILSDFEGGLRPLCNI